MAEVIVIDDSSEDDEEELVQCGEYEVSEPPHMIEMKNLRDRLRQHFSSSQQEHNHNNSDIAQWRMKLNPFRTYGFLHSSEFACKELGETTPFPLESNDFESPNDDASDDFMSNIVDLDSGGVRKQSEDAEKHKLIEIDDDSESIMEIGKNMSDKPPKDETSILNNDDKPPKDETLILSNDDKPSKDETLIMSNDNKPPKDETVITTNDDTPPRNEASIKNNDATPKKDETSITTNDCKPPKDETSFESNDDNRDPYYLKNFIHILTNVLASSDVRLFNDSEIKSLHDFKEISDSAKKLYIRLYQRKKDWFRCDKIQYPRIADDLTHLFKELVECGLMNDESSLDDFDRICNLLTAPEIRLLSVDIKLKVDNKKDNSKTDLIKLLKRHCTKQRIIFMSKNNSMKSILSKKAKKYIGKCVKLTDEMRFLFTRVISLFCLTTSHFVENKHNNSNGTPILYQMLLSNLGDVIYPDFKLTKQREIFQNREQLIEYTHAIELENDLDIAVEKKDFKLAMSYYARIRSELQKVLEGLLESKKNTHSLQLPGFLSSFSKEWVTLRVANKCVEVLEKERNYPEAVLLIELLLSQRFMRLSSRGFLWKRLVLDCERHIKDTEKCYLYTLEALKDPYLRTGNRHDILQRIERLEKSKKIKSSLRDKSIKSYIEDITEPKEEMIRTKIFIESSAKNRAVFLSPGPDTDCNKLSNVEQHVITHYEGLGFPSGRHGEGSTVTSLFYLLFWDIVFMDIDDVFQSKFQNSPLDMFSDIFYVNRKKELDERLNLIYHATEEYLKMLITNTWKSNYGNSCGVNWDLFEDEEEACDLATCIGRKVLGGICELFCKDICRRKSGFPDLIVWNKDNGTCKIIEVKAPGDKLSVKQIVWLDVLSYLGADAFVCHVTGVGGKRKRASVE